MGGSYSVRRLGRKITSMLVRSEFPGDNNRVLMGIQHATYGEMVLLLFSGPRDRYLAAAALLRIDNDLTECLRSMDGFDHRTLQLVHDRIAAFFRFSRDHEFRLGESEGDYIERTQKAWREFFQAEVGRFSQNDEFTRAVCAATAFGTKASGVAAERWLDHFIRDSYGARGLVFNPLTSTPDPHPKVTTES